MSLFTTMTRCYLTRSARPFTFKNEYDEALPFASCRELGLYIHIPFCTQLCSFCPYCRELYEEKRCDVYIDHLISEIHLAGSALREKKQVTSVYFGGGTPALAARRLGEIIAALKEHFVITEGIGLELHPDNVNAETLRLIKAAGVDKISIGIQSFGDKFLSLLGRKKFESEKLAAALKAVEFETVSMDFIFALPNQTLEDLKADIETAFSIGANHVAIYPFIDFTFANSGVKPMKKREKRALLDGVTLYCKSKGYGRDSIWTFSKAPEARYSSMTRENFLGFGCSAATLLMDQFKINTFSVEEYQKRIAAGKLPTSLTLRFTRRQRMVYYLFWQAYGTRVESEKFRHFFGESLEKMYGFELWCAKKLGFAEKEGDSWRMTMKGAFYYHHYENFYTLSYIDKMWSLMRNEAFPNEIKM